MNFWLGTKIRLRAVEPTDAETFFHWNQDSDRNRHLDFIWPPTSMESQKEWTAAETRRKFEEDRYHWVIETLGGVPVGTISTHHCNPHSGTFSYGVDVAEGHRRQGYAKEAILLILRYFFDELRYQKATIDVHADNTASRELHEALGFQREGVLRRVVYHAGKYSDSFLYGITVEEFRALHS